MEDFPAFPTHFGGSADTPGMTLRDYFAAKALAGMLANPNLRAKSGNNEAHLQVPFEAYRVADAMLAEREK